MGSWLLFALFVAGALFLRSSGDTWGLVLVKLVGVTIAAAVVAFVLSWLIVWWG